MGPLQEYRKKTGISASELASRSELSQPSVSRAEAGNPTLFTSIRLSIATEGAVMPWNLKLRASHRRALRQFAELIELLTVDRLRREGRLRRAA